MQEMNIQLIRQLSYAGLVPFLAGAFLLGWYFEGPVSVLWVETALMSYTLAIIAFLSGVHWAVALFFPEKAPVNLFVLSNALVVAAWLCFLIGCAGLFYVLAILIFAILLWVDQRLFRSSVISRVYFRLRRQVTLIAVACLVISLLF